MADWVLNPKKLRPSAQMPTMLHGATAESDARAIAAYLGSLKSGQPVKPVPVDADAISAGQALYKQLSCAACHTLEKEPAAPGKLAIGQRSENLAKRVRVGVPAKSAGTLQMDSHAKLRVG